MEALVDKANLTATVDTRYAFASIENILFDEDCTVTTDGRILMCVKYPGHEEYAGLHAMIAAKDARLMAGEITKKNKNGSMSHLPTEGTIRFGKQKASLHMKRSGRCIAVNRMDEGRTFPPWREVLVDQGEVEVERVVIVAYMLKLLRALDKANVKAVKLRFMHTPAKMITGPDGPEEVKRKIGPILFEETGDHGRVRGAIMPCT